MIARTANAAWPTPPAEPAVDIVATKVRRLDGSTVAVIEGAAPDGSRVYALMGTGVTLEVARRLRDGGWPQVRVPLWAVIPTETPDESTSDNPVPLARIDALGLAANRID